MDSKTFVLFFAFCAVNASAAIVCKCGPDKKAAVSKCTVKVDEGGEQYDETIKIDTGKKTETFHIPNTGSLSAGEVDAVYDFNKVNYVGRNLAMHRMSSLKACFLSDSTEDLTKPHELVKLFDKKNSQGPSMAKSSSEYDYEVVGTVTDRSVLSDEMAVMCAKMTVYSIKEKNLDVEKQKRPRVKQHRCIRVCYKRCWSLHCGKVFVN